MNRNSRIRLANAPCSWGVLEFDQELSKPGYEQVLSEMLDAGFSATELGDWGFLPTDPEELQRELDRLRMTLVAAFVPVALADRAAHRPGAETAVRTARLLAAAADEPSIVLADDNCKVPQRVAHAGRIQPEHGLSPAAWKTFAAGAEMIASTVRQETGLRTVFHHHAGGFVETPAEVATLMELTDPALLGLCLDSGHYAFGGGDPVDALRRYGDRIWHVHFKDCDPQLLERTRVEGLDYFESVKNGIFCELGRGGVSFPALLANLRQRDYHGWIVVEQDVLPSMGSPLESARRNRAFLSELGL